MRWLARLGARLVLGSARTVRGNEKVTAGTSTRGTNWVYAAAVKKQSLILLSLLLVAPACGPKAGDAKAPASSEAAAFQYAPRIGSKFRHVMTRAEELTIVGTPLRQLEEWTITWDVTLS